MVAKPFKSVYHWFLRLGLSAMSITACRRLASPVLIIAPPRSGSTFLFECLRRLDGMLALRQEADHIWWRLFPYRPPNPSDLVEADEATSANVRRLNRLMFFATVQTHLRQSHSRLRAVTSILIRPRRYRYLDKTIANCFHLEFLRRAYPDARYIFLVRDPRANISSMMESWPHIELVGKPQLTPYLPPRGSTITHWSFPAPPGWQEQVHRSLAEICAWSWQQHIEFAWKSLSQCPGQVIRLRYEELVSDPARTVRELAAWLEVPLTTASLEYAADRPASRTTISSPADDKWHRLHYDQVMAVLPMIRETAQMIGYEL